MSGKEWWESFFRGAWLDVQKGRDTAELVDPAASFIELALALEPGQRVLDVPCGEGRLSRALARKGYRLSGLDLTAGLLAQAKRQARAEKLDMELKQGDMRKIPWRARFHGAFCWWGSFGYFDEAGNLAFLKSVLRSLRPGGRFLLDGHCAETIFPFFDSRQWVQEGETTALLDNHYDPGTGRVEMEWTFLKGGRKSRRRSSIRIYTLKELSELAWEAGFSEVHAFGGLSGEPFELGSGRLLLLAEKAS